MVKAAVTPAGLPLAGVGKLGSEPDSPLLSPLRPRTTFFVQNMAFLKT